MDPCMETGAGIHLNIIKISKKKVIKPNLWDIWRIGENLGRKSKENEWIRNFYIEDISFSSISS